MSTWFASMSTGISPWMSILDEKRSTRYLSLEISVVTRSADTDEQLGPYSQALLGRYVSSLGIQNTQAENPFEHDLRSQRRILRLEVSAYLVSCPRFL
jgi:hypothetical protein